MFMRRNFSNGGYVIHGATLPDYPESRFSAWFDANGALVDAERRKRFDFSDPGADAGSRQRAQLAARFGNRCGESEFGG